MADVFDFFLHNWIQNPVMDTEWSTVVSVSSLNLVEERRGLTPKPRRTITVNWTAVNKDEAHRLWFLLQRMGYQRLRIPVYQDVQITTASSSGTTINCPHQSTRFNTGYRFLIHERTTGGRPTNVQQGYIHNLDVGPSFTTVDALTGSYPAGSAVYPVMECELLLDASGVFFNDETAGVQATFSEIPETAIDGEVNWDSLSGFDQYASANGDNYFLFDVGLNWAKDVNPGMFRSGNQQTLGRGNVVTPRGPRPQATFRFSCDQIGRDEAFKVLEFFDAHRGQLIPFFVANPLSLWTVENMGVTFVDVTRSGAIDDVTDLCSYLYLEMTNGDVYVKPITAVSNNAGLNRLSVTLPALFAADVKRATTAHLVRFRSDAIREEWFNNEVASFTLDVQEVLNERAGVTGAL